MKRHFLILTLFGFFFFIFGNWFLSLTSPDEGKNAYAALHMLRGGDWIVPFYNCHYRFEKPPLFYWLTALAFKFFGVNEFSARIVSGFSALFTSYIVYFLTRDFIKGVSPLFGVLIFDLLIHNWIEARSATPEMLLTFLSTLGVYLLLKEKTVLGWLVLALAFLAKGPVGVVLPLLVVFVISLLQGGFKKGLKLFWERIYSPFGWILFLLVAPSWYLLMLYKFGWNYFYKFFILENIARFTGKAGIHIYPWWYYIPVVLTSTLLFLPIWFKALKGIKKEKLLWGWFFTVFTFYSLSKGKLHHYMLFAYPPLASVFAQYTSRRYLKISATLGGVLFASLLAAALVFERGRFTPKAVAILKRENPQRVFFYKDENSAVVFYLYRCIPNLANLKNLQPGDYVITKEKHLRDFKNVRYRLVVKGKEFQKEEVLVEILP
jgi:4-amino-4-deoxy-L-arabinose transferase-like glycosyltransferase